MREAEYFRSRAAEELEASLSELCPIAADAHRHLGEKYARLADELDQQTDGPRLTMRID